MALLSSCIAWRRWHSSDSNSCCLWLVGARSDVYAAGFTTLSNHLYDSLNGGRANLRAGGYKLRFLNLDLRGGGA